MGQCKGELRAFIGTLLVSALVWVTCTEANREFTLEESPDLETWLRRALEDDRQLFEPEVFMTTVELATSKGYPCETHPVKTEDGYILTLHRIPHGAQPENFQATKSRPIVLLQVGFLESSADFLLNLANQSLAFILADAGADVWLGNMRGAMYSSDHMTLSPSDPTFWNYTFEEQARYDLPAMVNYIVNITRSEQIIYVGYSLGAGQAFIEFSRNANLASRIRHFFALAPATRLKFTLAKDRTGIALGIARKLLEMIVQDLGPENYFVSLASTNCRVLRYVCRSHVKFCTEIFSLIAGVKEQNFNTTRIPVYIGHAPQPISRKGIAHLLQLVFADDLRQFDEGSRDGNKQRYGQPTPPLYDLSNFKVPATIFYGGNDILVEQRDITWLMTQLSISKAVFLPKYHHLDFIWGLDARSQIYDPIIDAIFLSLKL